MAAELDKSLDRKIIDFNFQALGFIAAILFKPLATATDPLFRSNLGERYFTVTSFFLGQILWWIAAILGKLSGYLVPDLLFGVGAHRLADWVAKHNYPASIGFVLWIYFCIRGGMVLGAALRRQRDGIPWHSMSRGTLLFGNIQTEYFFFISVGMLLLFFAPMLGLFFVVSRLLSYYLAAKEQHALYARYLDAMDAKLQAEFLEKSLRDGEPPQTTDGIYTPLPKRFQGQHRSNVAKTIVSGMPARVAPIPYKKSQTANVPNNDECPSESAQDVQVPSKPRGSKKSSKAAFPSSRILILLAGVIVVGGIVGLVAKRDAPTKSRPAATPEASKPVSLSAPKPTQPLPAEVLMAGIQKPTIDPEPVRPIAPTAQAVPTSAQVKAAEPDPKPTVPQVDPQAEIRRDIEAKTQQIQSLIKEQTQQLEKFKQTAEQGLADTSKKVASLSRSKRKEITKRLDAVHRGFLALSENCASLLAQTQKSLASASPSELPGFLEFSKEASRKLTEEQEKCLADIKAIDAEAEKLSKKPSGFITIK